jgi:hypothetical protein
MSGGGAAATGADGSRPATGGCLCGAVRYEVRGPLRDVINCHCSMCQRLHGGFGPHSKASKSDITVTVDVGLAWYRTSEVAQRGFCRICGSGLFWQPFAQDGTGILAGTLDAPTGLQTIGHIFVAEKSDFYEISDGLPQFAGSSDGELAGDHR